MWVWLAVRALPSQLVGFSETQKFLMAEVVFREFIRFSPRESQPVTGGGPNCLSLSSPYSVLAISWLPSWLSRGRVFPGCPVPDIATKWTSGILSGWFRACCLGYFALRQLRQRAWVWHAIRCRKMWLLLNFRTFPSHFTSILERPDTANATPCLIHGSALGLRSTKGPIHRKLAMWSRLKWWYNMRDPHWPYPWTMGIWGPKSAELKELGFSGRKINEKMEGAEKIISDAGEHFLLERRFVIILRGKYPSIWGLGSSRRYTFVLLHTYLRTWRSLRIPQP